VALLTSPDAPPGLRSGRLARWLHVDALHPELDQVTSDVLQRSRRRNLPIHVWTVNAPERIRDLRAAGVAGIIGDDPHDLVRYGREPVP
jgi:glycerophosphoryl diester phosphodiesterase